MIATRDGKDFAQFPIRALKPDEAQSPARIKLKAHGRPKKTSSEMPDENLRLALRDVRRNSGQCASLDSMPFQVFRLISDSHPVQKLIWQWRYLQ